MQRNRAWRRSQRERKIQRIYRWVHANEWFARYNGREVRSFDEIVQEQVEYAKKRHSSPKCCSRWCCGNPRKHFGTPTEQEVRFAYHCEEEYSDNNIRKDFQIGNKRW